MKWTINELAKRGKTIHTVDLSNQPAKDALTDVSELPDSIQAAVIGVTKKQPADVVEALKNIHEVIEMCLEDENEDVVSEIANIQEFSFHTLAVEV